MAGIDAQPVWLDETASTNDETLAVAARGAPGWTIVAAGHQTRGRGREGRSWASVPGKLLQFSVLLRPPLPPDQAPLLALLAAVEMARACEPSCERPVRTKWPNDLVVGGRKLAGILAEARTTDTELEHLVLGIGVNVGMTEEDFPEELRGEAPSLAVEGAADVEPMDLLGEFLRLFYESAKPESPRFPAAVVAAYTHLCDTLGRRVRATTMDGRTIEGTAEGLDAHGGLIVDGHGVGFGEIAHLDRQR